MCVDINNTGIISGGPVFKYLSIDQSIISETREDDDTVCVCLS